MGQQPSQEEADERVAQLFIQLFQWDDLQIDSSLERFSGLNSAAELNRYRDQVLYNDGLSQAASVVEKMGSALSGLSSVPHAVGLGALVISLALDVVGKSLNKETLGTAGMLERVFAQEKAKEVRDLMHEYLKRMQINLRNPQKQLSETRQIELDLSAQLTRLKDSMLLDEQLDGPYLRQWVNGAAFHTQMLIHEARLERREEPDGSRAMQAAGIYQHQLNLLMDKHISWLVKQMSLMALNEDSEPTRKITKLIRSKPQISWTQDYFSKLQANIPSLVRQNAAFYIQT